MTTATQNIKVTCHNYVLKGSEAKSVEGHPWRSWKISLVAMDGDEEVKGKLSMILNYVQYILHPTFSEPHRTRKTEPYVLQEKGWGEFDLKIVLYFKDDIASPQVLSFDLNFAQPSYSKVITIDFPNASSELIELLASEPSTSSSTDASVSISRPRKGGKKPRSAAVSVPADKPASPPAPSGQSSEEEDGQYHEPVSSSRKRKNSFPAPKEEEARSAARRRSSEDRVTVKAPMSMNLNQQRKHSNSSSHSSSHSNNSSSRTTAKAPSSLKRKNSFSVTKAEEERAARRPRHQSDTTVRTPPATVDSPKTIAKGDHPNTASSKLSKASTQSKRDYTSNDNSSSYISSDPKRKGRPTEITKPLYKTSSEESLEGSKNRSRKANKVNYKLEELEEGEDRESRSVPRKARVAQKAELTDDDEEGLISEDDELSAAYRKHQQKKSVNKNALHNKLRDRTKEKHTEVEQTHPTIVRTVKDVYRLERNYLKKPYKNAQQRRELPPQVDVWELARRLVQLTPEQNKEFQRLIIEYAREDEAVSFGADEKAPQLDLRTCSNAFLEKLWEFTEDYDSSDDDTEDPLTDVDDALSEDYILDARYRPNY